MYCPVETWAEVIHIHIGLVLLQEISSRTMKGSAVIKYNSKDYCKAQSQHNPNSDWGLSLVLVLINPTTHLTGKVP